MVRELEVRPGDLMLEHVARAEVLGSDGHRREVGRRLARTPTSDRWRARHFES